ncbi:hypothetical protein [Streptomyces specialis]|uniref:hypothetical protein n=1 Tax=Streptomyces specialis TaxID=498367 RepID=UPI00073E3D43|nr:hypothetical protein [Streptomyces specialis]
MDVTLAAALIAAVVTAGGWLANHLLATRAERLRRRREARLAHVERQLSELYGPLFFLVHEGKSSFEDFCRNLGRPYVFGPGGTITPEDLDVWLFWVDQDFMPRNQEVQRLLSSKAHLIVGETMPDSYLAFMDHYNSWRVSHLRWREKGVPYRWTAATNWPVEFGRDVITTYAELKRLQNHLAELVTSG